MVRLKTLWRNALSPHVCEELGTWARVLLALGAAVLLFATLKAQAAYPVNLARTVGHLPTALESTMAAGARSTPRHEAYVHAVRAPGMPPIDGWVS
jgi:hypothetical protein